MDAGAVEADGAASGEAYRVLGFDGGERQWLELTDKEISRAYRKQALRWHPDKNPGDEQAKRMLEAVFAAYELLSDADRRAQYDQHIRAFLARKSELAKLDSARRRLREDLERRERAAEKRTGLDSLFFPAKSAGGSTTDKSRDERLKREIEKLRNELGAQVKREEASTGYTGVQRDDDRHHDLDARWTKVPGFRQFIAADNSFEDLEQVILARAAQLAEEEGP